MRVISLIALGGFLSIVASGWNADAQVISVNFGDQSTALGAGEAAGVVSAMNWNNGTTANGGGIANLNTSAGAASGVALTYAGGGMTNNFNLATSGNASNNKMMSHYWNTNNESIATNLFVETGGTRFHQSLARVASFGPRDNTATFTGLNAVAPNGYDVYVYVSGASAFPNEVAGHAASGVRSYVSPVHVLAAAADGGPGLISAIQTGNVSGGGGQTMMSFGPDNPGFGGLSIENPANLPGGTLQTILNPATFKPAGSGGGLPDGSYYSADFQGFVAGALGVTDNYPLDYGPPNEHGHVVFTDPALVSGLASELHICRAAYLGSGLPRDST